MDLFGETVHYITIHASTPIHVKSIKINDKICQNIFFCHEIEPEGTWITPIANQTHLYIPVNQENHFFEIEIRRQNDEDVYFLHPHLDAFHRILDCGLPHDVKDEIKPFINNLDDHGMYEDDSGQFSLFSNSHDALLKGVNHDSKSHATRLFKRSISTNRDSSGSNRFRRSVNKIVNILGGFGYGIKNLFANSKIIFEWGTYLNTMEFVKFYYDKAWDVVWESFPVMQHKLASFMDDQKNVNVSDSLLGNKFHVKNPLEEVKKLNETKHAKDIRILFSQHLIKNTLSANNWTESLGDAGSVYEQLLPFYDDIPDMTEIFNMTGPSEGGLPGFLDKSKEMLIDASTLMIIKSFKYVQYINRISDKGMNWRMKFPGSKTIEKVVFQDRFELSLANLYHMATAVSCYYMYYGKYQTAPITAEDVVSFKKAPSASNILHTWLYDQYSGTPTPWKEYRLRCIIDWFPRLYFGLLMVYITIAFELLGDTSIIPRAFLAINAAMFVPTAFPIDMIEPHSHFETFKQLNKLYVPGFIIGYGWNLMSIFVWLRPGLYSLDSFALKRGRSNWFTKYVHNTKFQNFIGKKNAMELIWEKIKAVAFGIPQLYGVYHLIPLLKARVHMNDYRQVGMWTIQSTAWTLDSINNLAPLLRGINTVKFDFLQGFTGRWMTALYLSRSYWEVLHGMPNMFIYYQSCFTPAQDLQERVKQVNEIIPEPLRQWQDIHGISD